jgi:hypothetical protein
VVVIQRWVVFWALRRAYRVLLMPDPRPLRERLTREARQILLVVGIALAAVAALVVAGVVALVWVLA